MPPMNGGQGSVLLLVPSARGRNRELCSQGDKGEGGKVIVGHWLQQGGTVPGQRADCGGMGHIHRMGIAMRYPLTTDGGMEIINRRLGRT